MAELSRTDREAAIAELERICTVLEKLSGWFSLNEADQAAILCESSWRDLTAACYLLQPPRSRRGPPGWLGDAEHAIYGAEPVNRGKGPVGGGQGWTDRR
jgi:hypothetical protein